MKLPVLSSILYLSAVIQVNAQFDLKLSPGVGYPSGPYVGVAFSSAKIQFEFDYGWPAKLHEKDFGTYWAMNFGVRFGQESEITHLKSWIFRIGPSLQRLEDEWEINKRTSLILTFGREFNFSNHFGCEFQIGPALTFYKDEMVKKPKPDPDIITAIFVPFEDIRLPIDTKIAVFLRL